MTAIADPILAARVKFPATQVPSADVNTLDDYEEGTWTPVPTNLTVVGTPTYAGYYTKIGRVVHWTCRISSTTTTASTTGSTTIAGLPFGTGAVASTCMATNESGTSGAYTIGLVSATTIYPPTWAANAAIVLTGVYFTA